MTVGRIVRPEPMSRQVCREIREAILRGRIPPGQQLVEAELARSLGTSRTPVREAILFLQAEGLVEPLAGGGVAVKDIRRELEDIVGVREALEVYAVRRAVERIGPEAIARLEANCDEFGALPLKAVERRARLNREFHETLVGASGNARLLKILSDHHEYFLVASRLYDEETVRRSAPEHREILEAVKARDAARAEALLRAHITGAAASIIDGAGRPAGGRRERMG
ncbi:MAG TPA: GntR family transcriptional regulator [Thermodesulfobacteriota bacterium]